MGHCHDDCCYPFDHGHHYHHHHYHSWCNPWYHSTCLTGTVSLTEKNGFELEMDVHHFKFEEISVKTLDDVIVIKGKQAKIDEEAVCITKEFTRKYKLPKGYDPKSVISTLSSDGILHVKAPKPEKMPEVHEIIVEIKKTGSYYGSSEKEKDKDNSNSNKKKKNDEKSDDEVIEIDGENEAGPSNA